MKVILQQDIKKIGNKGEVVKVADGYARNYLLPRGLAVEATEGKLQDLQLKKKKEDKKHQQQIEEAKELAKKLEAKKFQIAVKAGENGRLFGSVTTKDIAEKVKEAGFKIDKRKIEIDDHIKSLGMHKVPVRIFEDVFATLKIQVIEA